MGEGFTRRNRFIVACALAMGLGVTMVPQWAENNLWPEPPAGQNTLCPVLECQQPGVCYSQSLKARLIRFRTCLLERGRWGDSGCLSGLDVTLHTGCDVVGDEQGQR